MKKLLPIGIQTFSKIRSEDYYYVDKTELALKLITEGDYFFLSRPRRFGKSLFIDTLAELFEGNEPLFRGLYCHDRWDWSVRYPVIRISFGAGVIKTAKELNDRIHYLLNVNGERLGIAIESDLSIPAHFSSLLRLAEEKYGQRVVVLVDEYDKPILDNLEEPETAKVMRDGLRDLYSVIKDNDTHIRFAFLTGVSKFSKVSIFSGLNNLRDITISKDYSTLCGYTDHDVDTVFAPELPGLDRQQIRDWYNGYNWTGESVYNPFDLLLLFKERQFRPYWFETGTPTFLVKLLTEKRYFTPDLAQVHTSISLLSSFEIDNISPEAVMFQAGYLTINKVAEPMPGRWIYTLGYPNMEVKTSLNEALMGGLVSDEQSAFNNRIQLLELLQKNDLARLEQLFRSLFASIPNDWYRNSPITRYEGYWASLFYSHFAALGLDIILEDVTNKGRIDMTVLFNGQVYLFEFKVVEQLPEGKALQQLKDRNYAEKYRSRNEPIHLIGLEFSSEERNLVGFEMEGLG